MKPDTPLDSVSFELDETRTRCELWITAGDSSEKLASGFVMPFLSHLPAAHEQLESGEEHIRLQAPPCPVVQGTPWFTKKTIERIVRFVSTPDVLERVNFLERERIKLAEATSILLTKSPQMSSVPELAANADGGQGEGDFQAQAIGGHSMDSLEMETESSRRHLVSAMDARRLTLEKEEQKSFARAAAAGFSIDSLRELIAFAECFGATRLREACLQFSSLHSRRLQESETNLEQKGFVNQQHLDSSPEPNGAHEAVKNFGRRRVWGPPVSAIPLQNGVPDLSDGFVQSTTSNNKLTICEGGEEGDDEEEEVDGALTGDGDHSPLKSNASSSSPSSRDSDWDEGTESSSKNPIYDNVIGQLERLRLASHREADEKVDDKVDEYSKRSGEAAAVQRRKGIIVIRNRNQVKNKVEDSQDGDEEESEGEGEDDAGGRLSVRAAISLFETKQKQSNDARVSKKIEGDSKSQQQFGVDASDSGKQKQFSVGVSDSKKQNLSFDHAPKKPTVNPEMKALKQDDKPKSARTRNLQQMPGSKKDAGLQKLKTPGAGVQLQEPLTSSQSTPKSADEISKELLDKSYSCLLKINSVVQDALLSASTLQQATQRAELKLTAAVEADNGELRVLPSLPVVDDMFLERPRAPVRRTNSVPESKPVPKPIRVEEPEADVVSVASSDTQKGRFYEQYQERREAKYKRESSSMKAEREAKLKTMQEVLERRKNELMGRSSRLFEKSSTLNYEQMKALKHQASLKTNNRVDMRSDRSGLQSEKPGTTRKPSLPGRVSQKMDSPTSKSLTSSSTRKTSPGPPKAPLSAPKTSGRLNSSPRSKLSGVPPVSQRRMPNFMSQSVITESLHAQADVRKENTKPPRRSNNPSGYQESGVSGPTLKQSSNSTRNLAELKKSLVMPLETNRVTSSSPGGTTTGTNRRSRATVRKGGGSVSEDEILAPLKIARDIAAEQNTLASGVPTRIPRAVAAATRAPRIPEQQQAQCSPVTCEAGQATSPGLGAGFKSSDECIKQIVSCNNTKERQKDSQDHSTLDHSTRQENEVISNEPEQVQEPEPEAPEPDSYMKAEKPGVFESQEFDEDMQIDEVVEKCMSGRSFLEGISGSPLINNFGLPRKNDHPRFESFKQELSSSLRTGPSSQSLPHLSRSLSPPALSSFRTTTDSSSSVKESRGICREHHQPAAHKDQPKGLKRLLKFGRKHRASDSNLTEWSTINEDLSESSSRSVKKSIPEESSSRTSGVRRSLEALPKIADAASELFSRNLFSSFRSKSSADSRA